MPAESDTIYIRLVKFFRDGYHYFYSSMMKVKRMKCVVVGAKGFLGAVISKKLGEMGRSVVGVDRMSSSGEAPDIHHVSADIRDASSLRGAFRNAEEVYHVAANLGTSELEGGIRGAIDTNILGTLNVLEAARDEGVARVFIASKPSVWLNTYTITKHCSEQIARQFGNYNPISVYLFRYLNIYGPGQKLQPVRKILPIFAAQAIRGLPVQIFGDGLQTVDMLFVDDAAQMTIDLMATPPVGRAIDCGTGQKMTVIEVANAVNDYFGNNAGIEHLPMRRGETERTQLVADTTDLDAILPDRVLTPWEQALDRSLRWYADLPASKIDACLGFYGIRPRFELAW